jgi:hypothetical protein
VRFVLRGENPRIQYKSERQSLLTNGASKGSITLQWDNVTVKRNVRDGKTTGDSQYLPDNELIADICLQAKHYSTLDDKVRRELTLSLADVDLSVDRIAAKLIEKGVPEGEVKKYRPLLMAGIKDAHAHAKRALSDARGAWKEVTGEVYGRQKGEDWKPEKAVIEDPGEIQKSLEEIDADIAKIKAEREEALAIARDESTKKTALVVAKILEYQELLRKPVPIPCPSCGAALLIVAGELKEYTGKAVEKRRIEALLSSTKLKKSALDDEQTKALQAVNGNYTRKLSTLEEDRNELEAQMRLVEKAESQETRAAELHKEAQAMERMSELLSNGPDGVAAALIAAALQPLNERLLEIGKAIGWQPAVIRGDMSIARSDGHPYVLLSESAQWRVDAMLHALVSELAEFPWLIFDRVDLLDITNRNKFIKWIAAYGQERTDEASILAMATLKQKPNLDAVPGIELHWLE